MYTSRGTLFLLVGLPGAGKTTRAKQLAAEHFAIRLTPDDWMIALFNHNDADGKRDVLEGRFIWLAVDAVSRGTNVVLDFGLWGRDERLALKYLAASVEAGCEVIYLPIDPIEQARRVTARGATEPHKTFVMSEVDLALWRTKFQPPDDQELTSRDGGVAPVGFESWPDWINERWPTALAK